MYLEDNNLYASMFNMDDFDFYREQKQVWLNIQKYDLGNLIPFKVIGETDNTLGQLTVVDVLFGKKKLQKFYCNFCYSVIYDYNIEGDTYNRLCQTCESEIAKKSVTLKNTTSICISCGKIWSKEDLVYMGVCIGCDTHYKPHMANPININYIQKNVPDKYHKFIFDTFTLNWKYYFNKVIDELNTTYIDEFVIITKIPSNNSN